MRVTIAQLNPIVGDVRGNLDRVRRTLTGCSGAPPDLVVFPELFLVGYPPKDLLEREWFIAQVQEAVRELLALSAQHPHLGLLVGAPIPTGCGQGKGLYNAALLLHDGRLVGQAHKALLPTYDVFDEDRYFDRSGPAAPLSFRGERLGVHVCEDAWTDAALWPRGYRYDRDPVTELALAGATLLINLSASPFSVGKEQIRYRLIRDHARRHKVPLLYVNQVGANDELVFDGRSLCVDAEGRPLTVMAPFAEEVRTVDTSARGAPGEAYTPQEEIASVHDALVLGIRDYAAKCGFSRAVVGLSGGIDSAVTCCLAAAALGPENVLGITMPSPYSSRGSIEDSRRLAQNLGIAFEEVAIEPIYRAYLETLAPHFAGLEPNEAEENLQARIRGNLLMAISNKFGHLVLSNGNKSELAVGYCTLYGDMSGGLAVISDVPKTMVYALARYINREAEIVPQATIDKPPSAELKPNQVDQDTLPPYPVLDGILHLYVEEGRSLAEIVAAGYDEATTRWVLRAVDRNEYKRRQAAPGLRVTTKAFGVGRRMPIAARASH